MDGVEVRRLGPSGRAHLNKWGLCLTALAELVRRRREFDSMLVCGYRVLGIPAMTVSRLLGIPCILKADSLGEFSGAFFDPGLGKLGLNHKRLPVSVALRVRNRLFRRAAAFVAVSGAVREELIAGGIPGDRIHDIPNSVDVRAFQPADPEQKADARARLGIGRDRLVAVYTGRLVSTKGLPALLRAWQGIAGSMPEALLLLVGAGGIGLQNCEAELREFVERHDLGRQIRFTGSVQDVREYLRAADLFVFPSLKESFGISVIEAMACGLPVIASDIPGLSDVVLPGVTARVVPPHNGDALRDAMVEFLNDRSLRDRMGQAGRLRVEEQYSESRVVDRYDTLVRAPMHPDGYSET